MSGLSMEINATIDCSRTKERAEKKKSSHGVSRNMVFEDSLDMEANIKNHYNYFFSALESSFK